MLILLYHRLNRLSIEPGEKIQTVHKSKTSQIVFQTIFHCRVRLGEADLHHCLPVQITIRISDLLDELPQPVLSRCRRIKPDAASLNKCASVNRFRADIFHCFYAHHILSTSCFVKMFRTKGYGRASCEDTLPHSFHPETI